MVYRCDYVWGSEVVFQFPYIWTALINICSRETGLDASGKYSNPGMIKLFKRPDQRDQRDQTALLLKDNATSVIATFAVPDGPRAFLNWGRNTVDTAMVMFCRAGKVTLNSTGSLCRRKRCDDVTDVG